MMEEHRELNDNENREENLPSATNRWLLVAAVALLVAAVVAFGYGYQQQTTVGHLKAQESVANATINDMQGQLSTLTTKFNEMSAAQQAAAQAEAQKKAQAVAAGAKTAVSRKSLLRASNSKSFARGWTISKSN
jgi:phage shock protein A